MNGMCQLQYLQCSDCKQTNVHMGRYRFLALEFVLFWCVSCKQWGRMLVQRNVWISGMSAHLWFLSGIQTL